MVHQPASQSIWPAVSSLQRGLSTNSGVTTWRICGCSLRGEKKCFAITERSEMGLYDVSMFILLFDFGISMMFASFYV